MEKNPTREKRGHLLLIAFILIFFFSMMLTAIVVTVIVQSTTTIHIYIQNVYVPALDTSTSTSNGTTPFDSSIFVDLRFYREDAVYSVDYGESVLVMFYSHGTTPVTAYRLPAFSMGRKRTVRKRPAMNGKNLPWEEAFRAVSGGSIVELKVELRTEDHSVLAADVAVDASGHMVPKGPIQLC